MSINKSRHYPTSFTTFNSKWMMDINVKHKMIKILEDDIGENFSDDGLLGILQSGSELD